MFWSVWKNKISPLIAYFLRQLVFVFSVHSWQPSFELFFPSFLFFCSLFLAQFSLVSSTVVPPTLVSSAAAFFQTSPAAFPLSLRCHPSIWNIHNSTRMFTCCYVASSSSDLFSWNDFFFLLAIILLLMICVSCFVSHRYFELFQQ